MHMHMCPVLSHDHTWCTANELGWSDLTAACDGLHHTQCPVEATRIYNRRWESFLKSYLKGSSPIGNITRVWWRQEDQVHSLCCMRTVYHPTLCSQDIVFTNTNPSHLA